VADHEASLSSPKKRNDNQLELEVLTIARLRRCNHDTKQLIASAKHELATSYMLLAKIDRILAWR
jgi:hypothetical protein